MALRLIVDRNACSGHGLCYGTAPDLVDSDEQGSPVILHDPVPAGQADEAHLVVDLCPERALRTEAVGP